MSETIVTDDLTRDVLSVTGDKIGSLATIQPGKEEKMLVFVAAQGVKMLPRSYINNIADAMDEVNGFKGDKKEIADLKQLNRQLTYDLDQAKRAYDKVVIANAKVP